MAQPASAPGKLVIPSHLRQQTPAQAELEVTKKWSTIAEAIEKIFNQKSSTLSFQTLYSCAYHIVLAKRADLLYDRLNTTITAHAKQYADETAQCLDETFLIQLVNKWELYRTSISSIRDVMMYMDKNYVPNAKKKGVFDLGLDIFLNTVLKHSNVLVRLQKLMLAIIDRERQGEAGSERSTLKSITNMLVEIGKKSVYEDVFEQSYLDSSRTFYKAEASEFFANSTTPEYLRKVVARLKEENDRVDKCLDAATRPRIQEVVQTEMVTNYVQKLLDKEHSGFNAMLTDWKVEELRLVFDVFSLPLVKNGLQAAVIMLREFAKEQALQFLKAHENDESPLDLVDGLLQMKARYDDLLVRAFSIRQGDATIVDKDFKLAVQRAFEDVVNKPPRFAEYISLYMDTKLKKGKAQASEEDLERISEGVLTLFRFLRDKDVFERHYKNHLSKRLLAGRSLSDDSEHQFIAKLKTECGNQFTSKLEGMFKDMATSSDLMEGFKTHIRSNAADAELLSGIDVTVQVLTQGHWPFPAQGPSVNPPPSITNCSEVFKKFYLAKHTGRRLNYYMNMGNADLKLTMPSGSKRYDLNVSTYQMCILMHFNSKASVTFSELQSLTDIPIVDLKRNLLSLVTDSKIHPKLLTRTGKGKEIDNSEVLEFNPVFQSKSVKIRITPVVLKETEEESKETQGKVEEDRKHQIDAVIVRVMKSRKQLEHRDLVVETTKQLAHRFMPGPDDIKRRIESLIEREYLERSQESRSKYVYLA